MQAINQDDTTERSSKRSRPTLEDLPRRGLYPNNHHFSDNANVPAGACHIKPYPVSLPLDQQKRFSQEDLDQLKNVLDVPTKSQDELVRRLPTHNKQNEEHAFHVSLPPDNRHYLPVTSTEPTNDSHHAPYPRCVPPERQLCFYPQEHHLSENIMAQSTRDHNEQVQEHTRQYLSETYTEPTDDSHLAPYPRCVPHEQQFCFYREELDPSKNVLARSLPAHNEQVQEHASDTGLSSDNRHHLSDTSSEPTDATHLAPSSISLSTNQHLWLKTDDLDLFKSLLDEPTESQDDRDQSLSHHNERALENSFHTGLPPDGQMDSNAIFWFDCSQINSLDFRTDIGANQAECQLIAAGSVLNHHDVQALGLLLIQALLWLARNTFKNCCRNRGGCEIETSDRCIHRTRSSKE